MSGHITQVASDDELCRRSGITEDGEVLHHIYVDQHDNKYFSATTILDLFESDNGKDGLKNWREENDGTGDTEHHERILEYAQLRGTLCHAKAQEKYVDEQIWDEEEDRALQQLQEFGEYYGEDAFERYQRQVEWFVDEVHSMLDPLLDEVLYVENYCFNSEPSYAGQVDFVYRNTDGEIVVCDLKTSKHCSYKYFLQTNAYARVIEQELGETVDKLQICRAYPNEKDSDLHTVNRDEMVITVEKLIQTDEGVKMCLDSPFEAKETIKNAGGPIINSTWNADEECWTIPLQNDNETVVCDLAIHEITDAGWTVNIPSYIKNGIKKQVPTNEVSFKYENPYKNRGEQLTEEFNTLAKQITEKRPVYFPEELLNTQSFPFDKQYIQKSIELITDNIGQFGDVHPHEVCAAALITIGVSENIVYTEFTNVNKKSVKNIQRNIL